MTQKILGAAIILGALFGLIFAIKFVPVYVDNAELEDAFQECISWYEQYQENGCREWFKQIIDKSALQLDPASIKIDAAVGKQGSYVETEYQQKIDFFGIWTYVHTFRLRAEGTPPKRT